MDKSFLKLNVFPVVILVAGVMGVGIFSLPYIAATAGLWLVLAYLAGMAGIIIFIDLIVAGIALKTPDFKRIPGLIGYHLGNWAKAISLLTSIIGGYGVLLVYLIVGGEFLFSVFAPVAGGSQLFYTLLFFAAGSLLIFAGIKAVARFELVSLIFMALAIIFVFFKGAGNWNQHNFFIFNNGFDASKLFVAYGPVIFSLWGVGMIPEAEEMLGQEKSRLKKIIIISVICIALIYAVFTLLVLGITGERVTQSSLVGLKNALSGWAPVFALFAGALMVFNAFISLGIIMKKVFIYDLKISQKHAIVFTCSVPLILFLMGARSFIPIISLIGGVFIGIDAVLLLLIHKKLGGKIMAVAPLAMIFLLGAVYEIIFFKL